MKAMVNKMTLRGKLHFWWLKFRIKNKYMPNPRGTAVLNYIADKYLNDKYEPNYIIQPYEDMIIRYHDKTEKYVNKIFSPDYLASLKENNQYDDFIHSSAAMFMYVSLIYTFKDKQYWYDIIENEKIKSVIKQFVKLFK